MPSTVWHSNGHSTDYDALTTVFGNEGWDFGSLLPYFKCVENWTSPGHGAEFIPLNL